MFNIHNSDGEKGIINTNSYSIRYIKNKPRQNIPGEK